MTITCNIICYQGSSDNLIKHQDKIGLKSVIDNFNYNYIENKDIDNKIFTSTNHGLGADFLELFDHIMGNYNFKIKDKAKIQTREVVYNSDKYKYIINYDEKMPIFNMIKK